jgi:hypothetical protein
MLLVAAFEYPDEILKRMLMIQQMFHVAAF